MSGKKLGTEPAFPSLETNCSGYGNNIKLTISGHTQHIPFTTGISKRLWIATHIVTGNASRGFGDNELIVKKAYALSDELLKQENE